MGILRTIFQKAARLYPREHGKYSILTRIYFPFLAPKSGTVVKSKLRYNITMVLDITEYLQAHLYIFGDYELPTIRFLRSVLRPGSVCLDVGAQMGYLTLAMATSADRQTVVHSFEPELNNAERFRENIKLNDLTNVTLHQTAVSTVDGMLKLYLSNDRNAGTHSTVYIESNVSTEFVEIPSVRLDSFVNTHRLTSIDMIKIDVEGAEIDVINGAINVLIEHKPIIITELSDRLQQARGQTCREFKELMLDYGYQAYSINDNGTLQPCPLQAQHVNDNIVFVHAESRLRPGNLA
ncbi:MAG: hypothetical protein RLZZ273_1385 [Bacteroidota bacterium]|jgi:FkbM family methyltransferase